MSDTTTEQLLRDAQMLCQWIAETPHQRGSINGKAAQLLYAIDTSPERVHETAKSEHVTLPRAVLEQMVGALEINRVMARDASGDYTREITPKIITAALTAGRAVLEKGEAEPVAWIFPNDLQNMLEMETAKEVYSVKVSGPEGESVPLYAQPPASEPAIKDGLEAGKKSA